MLISKSPSFLGLLVLTANAVTPPRQAPGTPKFDCHSDCGSTIAGARIEGHCSNSTWIDLYEDCLDCAVEQNIWSMYGRSVGAAGQACGLPTTPDPAESGGDDDASSSHAALPSTTPVTGSPTRTETTAQPTAQDTASEGTHSPTGSGSGPGSVQSGAPTTSPVTAAAPGLCANIPVLEGIGALGLFIAVILY